MTRFGGEKISSGFYLPASSIRSAETFATELAAARFFPRVDGATVLHVHFGDGAFAVGDLTLTPQQFGDEALSQLGLPAGQPLILVGCQTAAPAPDSGPQSAVMALAALSGRPVIGASSDAYTTVEPGVVTAAHAGFDAEGRPVLKLGDWVVAWPDGRIVPGLGSDLLAILRDGTLAAALLPGLSLGESEPALAAAWPSGGSAPTSLRALRRGASRRHRRRRRG